MVVPIFFVSLLLMVQFAMPASEEVQFTIPTSKEIQFAMPLPASYEGFLGAFLADTKDEPPSLNFQNNLKNLLDTFVSEASKTAFHHSTYGEAPEQVYGLYMCRGDIDKRGCGACVRHLKDAILTATDDNSWRCNHDWRNFKEAVIWYENCMVRYSNKSFIGQLDDENHETTGASHVWDQDKGNWNEIRFAEVVGNALINLAFQAANDESGTRFTTKVMKLTQFESLYAMGQCTWDLTPSDCHKCLTKAVRELLLTNYYRGSYGVALYPSCMVRYDTFPFFYDTVNLPSLSVASLAMTDSTTMSLSGPDLSENIEAM